MTGCASNTAYYNVNDIISNTTLINLSNLNVFPNPTTGIIHIQSQDLITEIKLFNTLGDEVLITELSRITKITESKLNISELPRGIYLMRLKVNNEIIYHKIILQ